MNVLHLMPSPPKKNHMAIAFSDYRDAMNAFMQDWHNPEVTERYIEATRRWLDCCAEDAAKWGIE